MKMYSIFKAGYKILNEHRLIIEFRSGFVTMESLKAYRLQQANDNEFNPDFDILKELTEMDVDIVVSDLEPYANYIAQLRKPHGTNIKEACIVKTAHQIVYAQLLKKQMDKLSMQFNIYTNIKSAIDWLDKPITKEEVQ